MRYLPYYKFMPSRLIKYWRRIAWELIHFGPRRDITIDTANGILTVSNKDWLIGKYLYIRRAHEIEEIRNVPNILKECGQIFDPDKRTVLNVGANIGMTCIALLKYCSFEQAIALEPYPPSFRLLEHNIRQNGMSARIQAFPLALSSSRGELEFEINPANSGDNRVRTNASPGAFREERRMTIKVTADTLDHLACEVYRSLFGDVALIWVDVQGHEGHLIDGGRKFIKGRVPVISEFWPYGISRSGMNQQAYYQIICDNFSSFRLLGGAHPQRKPIREIKELFDRFSDPRQACLLLFEH